MFNALMMSYARLPMVLAEDGMLPGFVAKRNRYNVPWVAVLLCASAWALALPTFLIVYAAFVSRSERMAHMPALVFGFIVAAVGPILYGISCTLRTRRVAEQFQAGEM